MHLEYGEATSNQVMKTITQMLELNVFITCDVLNGITICHDSTTMINMFEKKALRDLN